jgi:hypothetical protein
MDAPGSPTSRLVALCPYLSSLLHQPLHPLLGAHISLHHAPPPPKCGEHPPPPPTHTDTQLIHLTALVGSATAPFAPALLVRPSNTGQHHHHHHQGIEGSRPID